MFSSSNLLSSSHSTPSSTSSTPRNFSQSLLNPTGPRNAPITVLPASSEKKDITRPLQIHRRGHSTSELLQQYNQLASHPIVKVTSTNEMSSSLPASNGFAFRDRSRTGSPVPQAARPHSSTSDHTFGSWWSSETHVTRPWHDSPKKKTVPPEQAQAFQNTRTRVAQAVVSALGTVADITHEALFIGVDLLDLAPIPGLRPVAELLLNIWDASQMVDMNRLSCLRLTERCADILISVREEIFDAGDVLGQELAAPIAKLEESFETVYNFLKKQNSRPFLKGYLRRDETLRDISDCDSALRDALQLFGISIQIRILRQVQESEKRRQVESKAVLEAIITGRVPPPPYTLDSNNITIQDTKPKSNHEKSSEIAAHLTTTENALGLFEDAHHLSSMAPQDLAPSQIIPTLTSLHSLQNSLDTEMDAADLRQLMRAALQTTSDAQMLEVLQIGHQEMPDALKTLQRALEHVAEREVDGVDPAPPRKGLVVAKVAEQEVEGLDGFRKRSKTVISIDSTSTTSTLGHSSERRNHTLDREFIESGIDALRRMTRGAETSLPSWTITKYEVDRDEKIGIGFFSDVYKGTWRGQTVAIKVLAESTPRKLFVREIEIWKTLRHPNVLQLCGASSASGDPPWFFVSAYMKNGSIVEHLKRIELEERPGNLGIGVNSSHMPLSSIQPSETSLGSGMLPPSSTAVRGISPIRRDLTPPGSRGRSPTPDDTAIHPERDLFRFMHEIAKGMEYLHSRGVLHGDLKGANVLVDDKYRCVISDFGQSEMKSELCRLSMTPLPHGTLRWQSPELMAGQSQLTQESDVWAFSICCVEILTMGRLPWPLHNDDSVRHFVLKDDSRPPLPDNSRFNTQGLQDILRAGWTTKPTQRPTFSKLVKDFKQLRNSGQEIVDSPRLSVNDEVTEIAHTPSPDMRPTSYSGLLQSADNDFADELSPELDTTFQPSRRRAGSSGIPHRESVVSTKDMKMPEVVIYTPVSPTHSSSFHTPVSPPKEYPNMFDLDECEPPPANEWIANIQNERRYRLLLTHDYHPSLTLPLWDPSPVQVGAVGYLLKPQGRFVTLFNALTPNKATHAGIRSLPSILGYGPAKLETHRQDRRTVTQKGMDAISGLLTFGTFSEKLSRRYSYPLKAGHQMAYLCTETTDYRYLEQLDAPKKWFQTHVDFIMQTYRDQHHIQKEDLFLVIGTLSAPNHALFVSHCHPEGHAHFSVYATPKNGKPWGAFTTDTEVPEELGPSYDESTDIVPVQSIKVSNHGGPWDTVLLARLRFKPDVLEPTSK